MFVVMKLQDFEVKSSPQLHLIGCFNVVIDKGKMVGFLPVYGTREDALADYPDAKLMEIREVNG